jgi:hypothetical protein
MEMSRLWQSICLACVLALGLTSAWAQEDGWPRTVPVGQGLVTIYPLQVDGMEGEVVRYRAALAYRAGAEGEPVFGAGWFESTVDIDRSSRLVHARDLRLTRTRFPEGTAEIQDGLAAALASGSTDWNLEYSLDRLETDLRTAAAERESLDQLNTAPPRIIYRDQPALLVTLDGDPLLREIENTSYQAVINTPYPMISDGRHFYLNVSKDVWYRADRATGPYRFDKSPPAGVAALVKPETEPSAASSPAEPVTESNAPEIVVATQPSELIVTDGPAVFVPLLDDLLVLQNSDDDVFMHVESQRFYIVLAGRWYDADSLNGPWSYRAADQLPPAFAEIPPQSEQADARVYVAGTAEAEEAVLDAQVPRTAAVERGVAEVDVRYDGEPDFQPVAGTDMQYAANTGAAVLQSDRRYYLVENGVWYVSDRPNGPWQVSAWRPQAVSQIAPTSPVYHVKYVYIYDSTPDVVYVGYTPGYLGSYVYGGTVVYGTGWHYRPWISPFYYYPRPSTWGFHVSYNPWSGWGFGLSWNWGWGWDPFYASYWSGGYWHHGHSWHHRHYGYWGPRGYRPHPSRYSDHRYGNHRYGNHGYGGHGEGGGRGGYRDRGDSLYRDPGRHGVVAAQPRKHDNRLRPSDLRFKAEAVAANQAATRSLMVADRSGKVRSKSKPAAPKPRLHAITERRASPGSTPARQVGSDRLAPYRNERRIAAQPSRAQPASPGKRGVPAAPSRQPPVRALPERQPRQIQGVAAQVARHAAAPRRSSPASPRPLTPPPQSERRVQVAKAPEFRSEPPPPARSARPATDRQAGGPRGKSSRNAEQHRVQRQR